MHHKEMSYGICKVFQSSEFSLPVNHQPYSNWFKRAGERTYPIVPGHGYICYVMSTTFLNSTLRPPPPDGHNCRVSPEDLVIMCLPLRIVETQLTTWMWHTSTKLSHDKSYKLHKCNLQPSNPNTIFIPSASLERHPTSLVWAYIGVPLYFLSLCVQTAGLRLDFQKKISFRSHSLQQKEPYCCNCSLQISSTPHL